MMTMYVVTSGIDFFVVKTFFCLNVSHKTRICSDLRPYIFALSYAQIPSLHARREDANKRFFQVSPFLLHSFPITFTKR